jgi:thioredoxin-related protein
MKKIYFLTSASITIVFLFVAISTSVIFFSCKKEGKDKTENLCPVVAASAVPQVVKDSFTVRYPATVVIMWFNKDSANYCAYFKTISNVETLAEFVNDGSFINEQIETHNDNEAEDSIIVNGIKTGKVSCECETHKEGD